MKRKLALATMFVFLSAAVAPPAVPIASAQGQQPTPVLSIPVSAENFTGTFGLRQFAVVNNVVNAVGTLTGTATLPTGETVSVVRTVSIPITTAATQAACDILHLELGPLNLDLLGLVVTLNRIVLDIEAQPGPGNLLGNLLCAVAGLLDNPTGLAQALNQILGVIGA